MYFGVAVFDNAMPRSSSFGCVLSGGEVKESLALRNSFPLLATSGKGAAVPASFVGLGSVFRQDCAIYIRKESSVLTERSILKLTP